MWDFFFIQMNLCLFYNFSYLLPCRFRLIIQQINCEVLLFVNVLLYVHEYFCVFLWKVEGKSFQFILSSHHMCAPQQSIQWLWSIVDTHLWLSPEHDSHQSKLGFTMKPRPVVVTTVSCFPFGEYFTVSSKSAQHSSASQSSWV